MISVWTILAITGGILLVFGISCLCLCFVLDGDCWITENLKRFLFMIAIPLIVGIVIVIFLGLKLTNADIEKITEFEISAEYDDGSNSKVKFIVTLPNGETDTYKNNDSFTDVSYIEKKTVLGKDFYELYLTKFDYASLCETIKLQSDTIKITN